MLCPLTLTVVWRGLKEVVQEPSQVAGPLVPHGAGHEYNVVDRAVLQQVPDGPRDDVTVDVWLEVGPRRRDRWKLVVKIMPFS